MLKKHKKLLRKIVILTSIIGTCLFSIWQFYLYPKVSLFDPDKRSNNFRNMKNIFPCKHIHYSDIPYHFKEKLHKLDNIFYEFDGKQHKMLGLLKRTETNGIIVVKDNKIIYEKYFQGNTYLDKNTSWSLAKSFTSALVGIAIADGHISSVNDLITNYIPELKQSGYRNVPIKHILQMSSGVRFSETYDDPDSDINELLPKLFLHMQSIKQVVREFPSERRSGESFHYMSLDAQVLGLLIERATGQSTSTYFETKLWKPLGAESNAFWLTDNHNAELTFCCVNATLRDYAKFGLLYLNNGYFNGKQIVPKLGLKNLLSLIELI